MVQAKKFVLVKLFDGFPKKSDMSLVEEELPPLKDGEFLAEAVYLSVDPYMRAYATHIKIVTNEYGAYIGSQIAKIIESKNPKFPVGKFVVAYFGWRSLTISDGKTENAFPIHLLPDFGKLPISLGLGVLGMPGNTAYFGFLELCQPKPGETVVVSGAAGAVGSIVGQIAKIKGCNVIGIAGSEEKGNWITQELGFDHFINYKTANLAESLKKMAPKGVDCYFDNVGGELSSIVIHQMNIYGRISVCGSISTYNEVEQEKATTIQKPVISKQLKMEGFLVHRWRDRWMEGITQMKLWIEEGKLKYHETVTEGFENMFTAFTGMLKGDNIGKSIIKA